LNFISALYSNEGNDERFQFLEVLSVAYSTQGDLFVLDAGENKIIKFQRETAQTAFGFFESGKGEINEPVQIDITSSQKIVVSDAGGKCLNIYDYFGNYLYKINPLKMKKPHGVFCDNNGRVYVTDTTANIVFIINESGEIIHRIESIAGQMLKRPIDISLFKVKKNVYKAYLIDEDEIIIFSLKYKQSGE
jgi:DNA-binding beta-propeller fold protein YncE